MFETKVIATRGGVPLRAAKGHFATNHSHINYFIDITTQKTRLAEAKAVARELAAKFSNTRVPLKEKIFSKNSITVSNNGSVGYAFYQKKNLHVLMM